MHRFVGLVLLLALAPAAPGQSITVPATVNVPQPGVVVIRATALDADATAWLTLSPGIQTFPGDVVKPAAGVFLGFCLQQGTYQVAVVAGKNLGGKAALSEPQFVTVVVGGPGPGPGPAPTDPFFASLNAQYQRETGPGRADQVKQLAAFFRNGASTTVNDPALKTVKDFQEVFTKAVRAVLGDPATTLPLVRAAIGAQLQQVLPRDGTTALDDSTRALIAHNYARIAADLEALK